MRNRRLKQSCNESLITFAFPIEYVSFNFHLLGLKKRLKRSEFLFSVSFSFYKMAPNDTVSHEISRKKILDQLSFHSLSLS